MSNEVQDLAKIHSQVIADHVAKWGRVLELPFNPQAVVDMAERYGGYALVDQQTGSLRSFLVSRQVGEEMELLFLASAFGMSRRGYSSALWKVWRALTEESDVWLEVHEKNQAGQAFYRSEGLRVVGVRPKYYSDGADAWVMSTRTVS